MEQVLVDLALEQSCAARQGAAEVSRLLLARAALE
jgi:hypothetical protein